MPIAYFRGTPAVMAYDLAATPRSDIIVQASGDAHLSMACSLSPSSPTGASCP
jgi:hypothetical protein